MASQLLYPIHRMSQILFIIMVLELNWKFNSMISKRSILQREFMVFGRKFCSDNSDNTISKSKDCQFGYLILLMPCLTDVPNTRNSDYLAQICDVLLMASST